MSIPNSCSSNIKLTLKREVHNANTSDDNELSDINDMIMSTWSASGKVRSQVAAFDAEPGSQLYSDAESQQASEMGDHLNKSDIDMADVYSVMQTAARGIGMLSQMPNADSDNQDSSSLDYVLPSNQALVRQTDSDKLATLENKLSGANSPHKVVFPSSDSFSNEIVFSTPNQPCTSISMRDIFQASSENGGVYPGFDNKTQLDRSAAPTRKKRSSIYLSDLVCLVCGDKASGVHYGVISCEGCKGFFRRALQEIGDINKRKCYFNKGCTINNQSRNKCQYCRLQKCLLLGMSRHAAKLGRRPWKMREDKSQNHELSHEVDTDASINSPQDSSIAAIDSSLTNKSSTTEVLQNLVNPEALSAFTEENSKKQKRPPTPELHDALEQARARNVVLMKKMKKKNDSFSDVAHNVSVSNEAWSTSSQVDMNGSQYFTVSANASSQQESLVAASPTILSSPNRNVVQMTYSTMPSMNTILPSVESTLAANSLTSVKTENCLYEEPVTEDKEHLVAMQINGKQILAQVDTKTLNILLSQQNQLSTRMKVTADTNSLVSTPQSTTSSTLLMSSLLPPVSVSTQSQITQPESTSKSDFVQKSPLKKRPFRDSIMTTLASSSTDSISYEDDSMSRMCFISEKKPVLSIQSSSIDFVTSSPSSTTAYGGVSAASSTTPSSSTSGGQHLQAALGVLVQQDLQQLPHLISEAYSDTFRFHMAHAKQKNSAQLHQMNEQTLEDLFGPLVKQKEPVHVTRETHTKCWTAFHERFNEVLQDVVRFAKRIPGFGALDTDDRVNLVRGGCFEVACVVHSVYIDEPTDTWHGYGNFVLSREQMKVIFPIGETFVELLFNYSVRFTQFRLTPVEMALLCAVMLITPDRPGLINRDKVCRLQESIIQALQQQILANHDEEPALFPKVLMSVTTLREVSIEHRKQLAQLKGKIPFPNDLYAETFNLV